MDITPDDYVEEEMRQLDLLESTGRYGPYEKEYIHKEGYRIPVRLSGQVIFRNGEKYIWSGVEDITEEKRIALALKRQRKKPIVLTGQNLSFYPE